MFHTKLIPVFEEEKPSGLEETIDASSPSTTLNEMANDRACSTWTAMLALGLTAILFKSQLQCNLCELARQSTRKKANTTTMVGKGGRMGSFW
jgi:hypothetical protein